MSKLITVDSEYNEWIQDVSQRFKRSQIKAAIKVNDEMLRFYWSLGRDISEKEIKDALMDNAEKFFLELGRGFSPLSGPVIREMLREFSGAIISVSHDRKYIDEVPDKVYELTREGLRSC